MTSFSAMVSGRRLVECGVQVPRPSLAHTLHIFPAHMRSAGSQAENRERLLAASWAPMVTAFEISSRALPFEAWATVPGLFKEAAQPYR